MLSCRGGDKLSRPVYLPFTHLGIKVKLFCLFCLFLLSVWEDSSIINIIQVQFSCFLYRIVPSAQLQGLGQAVHANLSPPSPLTWVSKLNYFAYSAYKHNSSQIQLFSLSHCSVCLVAGVGARCPCQFILTPTCQHQHIYQIL